MGYLRPVQYFHKGKRTEYDERVKSVIRAEQIVQELQEELAEACV